MIALRVAIGLALPAAAGLAFYVFELRQEIAAWRRREVMWRQWTGWLRSVKDPAALPAPDPMLDEEVALSISMESVRRTMLGRP